MLELARQVYTGNPLEPTYIVALNRLTIARSIATSLEKALYRRIGHAGALFSDLRIPCTEIISARAPHELQLSPLDDARYRLATYAAVAQISQARPRCSHMIFESLPLYEPPPSYDQAIA
jgi:hypothetical protein